MTNHVSKQGMGKRLGHSSSGRDDVCHEFVTAVFSVNTPKLPPVFYFLIKTIDGVGCPVFWSPLYLILTLMKLAHLGALGYSLINVYLWPPKVAAAIVNRTIDDQFGDSVTGLQATYSPTNIWVTQSGTCSGNNCLINPDWSQAFRKTYTAATYDPTLGSMGITMQFNGTAIYVFFILANYQQNDVVTFTSANFTVDDKAPIIFSQTPPLTSSFEYNALVFSTTNLSSTLHTLNITTTGSASAYVNFDYAIYTYDNDVSTTTSSLSSLSAVATASQVPSTTVTGAPAQRIPVGAIVGGIAGGITLFALVISLLFYWHRRGGHDALQSVRGNGGPEPLITQFNGGAGSLMVSAPGMPSTQPLAIRSKSPMVTVTVSGGESSNTDRQAKMHSRYRTPHSGGVVLSPPGSQPLPSSSGKALPSSTSNSNALGTRSNNRSASPLLPSPLNVTGTREEARRARQEDLNNQLRVVQHNIVQLEESSAGPGRSVRQTSGVTGEEMQMSVPDMQEAIRSMREQIHVLREQQQSAWAQGLSDDPPPGYTPMDMEMEISRSS